MNRRILGLVGVCASLLVVLALSRWSGQPRTAAAIHSNDALAALTARAGSAGFARALQPRPFVFPRDHALHADYRSEWWYFTGHLQDQDGRPFGFQLTLFRFEIDARQTPSASGWRTPRVVLGHFALSDIAGRHFHQFERLSRAQPGLAGASTTPPAVWLDDWRISYDDAGGAGHWQLEAQQDGIALALSLTPASKTVAQGEAGLSRKSATPGNASYYYSIPVLDAHGSVTLPGGRHEVSGRAWLDREWSTSALNREQAGWDWFALQYDDGSSIMFYRLRRQDGSSDPHSAGTFIDVAGTTHVLAADAVAIETLGTWHSEVTGRTYPQGWRLRIPSQALEIELTPRLREQEWQGRFQYWEGAVTITAKDGSRQGLGYVELTGY